MISGCHTWFFSFYLSGNFLVHSCQYSFHQPAVQGVSRTEGDDPRPEGTTEEIQVAQDVKDLVPDKFVCETEPARGPYIRFPDDHRVLEAAAFCKALSSRPDLDEGKCRAGAKKLPEIILEDL